MNHFVYETTNLVNGKKYIGKHSCKCEIEEDNYLGSGRLILKAISKYGRKNFSRKIIKICDSAEEAFIEERNYIEVTKANENSAFYNIIEGGKTNIAHFVETKNPIIFNHRDYLYELLNNGIASNDTHAKFKIKYLIEDFIINDMTLDNIIKFVSKYAGDYYSAWGEVQKNEDIEFLYNEIVKDKENLDNKHSDKEVVIYQSEIEIIQNILDEDVKNYVLACLVIYKILNQYSYVKYEWVEYRKPIIRKIANFGYKQSRKIKYEYNRWLKSHNYINTRNIEKMFCIPFCTNSGHEVIRLKGIDNINLLFRYIGKDDTVKRCKYCGSFFLDNKTKTARYCDKHKGYVSIGFVYQCCKDCGEVFIRNSRAANKIRCDKCQENKNREDKRKYMRQYRNSTDQKNS